ncbi:cytochrome b562 [Celerinatantimonas sp. YJH-8]|uniref:cytochrome b562 n=1 Tax=Celerinatantimonas sp. YJH-8 TaxID=3228714 RepID=UPI0038C56F04
MKKIFALAVLCASLATAPAFAAQDVGMSMMQMSQSYRAVMKDKTLKDLKADLANLKAAVLKAQAGVPDFLASKPAEDPMRQAYREGINKLLSQIKLAQEYASEGNFSKAQESASELGHIMRSYHKKLGV